MAYTIQAVIARAGSFGDGLPPHFRIVSLACGMEMIPFGEEVLELYDIPTLPLAEEQDFRVTDGEPAPIAIAPSRLLELCKKLSQHGEIAYIEAEYFGGVGIQAHIMFARGRQLAPSVLADTAINRALRQLGVEKDGAIDEFEAVGLGRHRYADGWLGVDDEDE